MLIPEFKLQQTDTHVIVSLRLPYVKVTACQFYIEEKEFKFFLKPYLLTLNFEQALKTAQQPDKAIYFHDKYILEVRLLKKNEGQFFENLNLLSSVIGQKSKKKAQKGNKVLVEVVGETENKFIENKDKINDEFGYGFCNQYRGVFNDLEEEAQQLFSFNPETVPKSDRFELSRKIAGQDLDENMYLFDKISNFQEIERITQNDLTKELIAKQLKQYRSYHPSQDYQKFKNTMKIPSKQLIISINDEPNIIKQLISICISYFYQIECMQGQLSVESPKTIRRTCSVFNCLTDFDSINIDKVILESLRRCISYSLYKHIDICRKVLSILAQTISAELITMIILNLHELFNKSECEYFLNKIYLDDYAVYLLAGKGQQRLTNFLNEIKIQKVCKNIEMNLSQELLEIQVEGNEELEMSSSNIGGELEELLKLD